MRIGTVIGKVTLNRHHPSLDGASLKLAHPMKLNEQNEITQVEDELLAVWDELGSGDGAIIAISEGPEATRPFRPALKPIDAYASALLDTLDLNQASLKSITKRNK